jgi:hypothetical protein
MPTIGTDLAQMSASMPELQALLQAERRASEQRIAELERQRETAPQKISDLEKERDNLRAPYEVLRIELELFKRRLFVAKAERADNEKQLCLEYEQKVRELDELAGALGIANSDKPKSDDMPARDGKRKGERTSNDGTGRAYRSTRFGSKFPTRTSRSSSLKVRWCGTALRTRTSSATNAPVVCASGFTEFATRRLRTMRTASPTSPHAHAERDVAERAGRALPARVRDSRERRQGASLVQARGLVHARWVADRSRHAVALETSSARNWAPPS